MSGRWSIGPTRVLVIVLLGLCLVPALARAATFRISLADGREVVGSIDAFEDGAYEVRTRDGTAILPVASVRAIEPSAPAAAQATSGAPTRLVGGTVRIAGAGAVAELYMPFILEAYAASAGGREASWLRAEPTELRTFAAMAPDGARLQVGVHSFDSASAARALAAGQIDIAILSRRMTAEEAKAVADRGLGNPLAPTQELELAASGIAVVAHVSNPVRALSLDQLAGVLGGRVGDWGELGAPPRSIQVIAPADGSGLLDTVRRDLLRGGALARGALRVAGDTVVAASVVADVGAIGIVDIAAAGGVKVLAILDTCGRPVTPSVFNVQTREYRLPSTAYLYTTSKASPATRALLDFAVSPAGQNALREAGLPSVLPFAQSQATRLEAPGAAHWPAPSFAFASELDRFTAGAERVSVAIRYAADGSLSAPESQRELDRLAAFLKRQPQPRRLVLLGFADLEGGMPAAAALSARGASAVEAHLKGQGLPVEGAFGLGSLQPLACGSTPAARQHNRRVEAWLLR